MSSLRDKNAQYEEYESRWELCDDLYEGEFKVHKSGEKYLPKLQDENDKAYQSRVKLTPLFNAFYRTISGLRGMIFRKPPVVEVPESITPLLENIDLSGKTFHELTQEVVNDALVFGRVGLLVDYPETDPNATKADAESRNYRPMIVKYDAESIYNWKTERIGGATVLSQVRLYEEETVQDLTDEFKITCEKRYRILDLFEGRYRQRVFKDKAQNGMVMGEVQIGDDIFPQMNGKFMDFIPFVVIGADCIGMDVESPPLIDLATTNLHHYMQATSYERGCFFSGLPTMFISGTNNLNADGTPLTISIGGNLANILPRPESKAYYVEVTGDFNALRTNLEDKKREMAVLGARMLEQQQKGVESGIAIAQKLSGEESLLSSMSQTVSYGLTKALQLFCEWQGVDGDVAVKLNRDFMPAGITSADMTALVTAWQQGAISSETMFDNLKAGEIINSDVTYEQEQERIASSMIGMTPPAATTETATPGIDEARVAEMIKQSIANMIEELRKTMEPASQQMMDLQPIADAIAAIPAPVVNIAQPAAPTINIAPPNVTVAAPTINIPEQQAPVVNVAPAAVNVGGATINMPDQPININVPEQPPANVTVNNLPPDGKKSIIVERDASGKIIGAVAE